MAFYCNNTKQLREFLKKTSLYKADKILYDDKTIAIYIGNDSSNGVASYCGHSSYPMTFSKTVTSYEEAVKILEKFVIEKEPFPEGTRVKTEHGLGTVIARCGGISDNWLVEHDSWHGGHNAEGDPLRWGRAPRHNTGWWYKKEEMTIVIEGKEPPSSNPKGSGVVSPSSFGYNIGGRVRMKNTGAGQINSKLLHDRSAQKGQLGTITGINGNFTEMLMDNDGRFCTRYEGYKGQNIEIITNREEKMSQLDGFSVGEMVKVAITEGLLHPVPVSSVFTSNEDGLGIWGTKPSIKPTNPALNVSHQSAVVLKNKKKPKIIFV